jgi:uncharacterized membrane protein HdeD (DUF308 family)
MHVFGDTEWKAMHLQTFKSLKPENTNDSRSKSKRYARRSQRCTENKLEAFLFQGIVMVILGILAVAWPAVATIAVDLYVGWLFLISGMVGLVAMFSVRDFPAFLWTLLTAALAMAAGVLLIWKPEQGAVSLTIVLTALFIAEGIFQIVGSFAYRDVMPGSWGWMCVSGICDLLLAAVLIAYWPVSASWALGLIVGINLITSGVAIVTVAIEARNFAQALVRSAA